MTSRHPNPSPRKRSRRSDAKDNDAKIVAAAREVFAEQGAGAPVSAIAARAQVGMNSLYRRWPSKELLIRELVLDSMAFIGDAARQALDADDVWAGFEGFVRSCIDAGINGSPRLTGSYEVTDEVLAASRAGREQVQQLVDRAQAAGVLRTDVNAHDIVLLVTELRHQRGAPSLRTAGLHDRLIAIVLDGLRPAAAHPLPAPPTTWQQMAQAWRSTDAHA